MAGETMAARRAAARIAAALADAPRHTNRNAEPPDQSGHQASQTAQSPLLPVMITGGSEEQRAVVSEAIKTLIVQSPSARAAFDVYRTATPSLTIEIMDEEIFKTTFADVLKDTPNAQAVTTHNGGGDQLDQSVPYNAIIYIRTGAIDPKQERSDRKANRETYLEALIGHELGHARSITLNFAEHHRNYLEDKLNKIDYYHRRNEVAADAFLKTIGSERSRSSGVRKFKKNLRFP
jgi:hypothetical protein